MSQVPQVAGDSNQSDIINNTNKIVAELNNRDVVQVYKGDDGNRSMLVGKKPSGKRGILIYDNQIPIIDFGQLENGSNGLKIAPNGTDVTTATDDQLVFNSANNVFKIVQSGTATVTLANPVTHFSTTTTSVTHDLGYKPAFEVFCTVDPSLGGELIKAPFSSFDGTGAFAFSIKVTVTDTTITFGVQPNAASAYDGTSWEFKYYLLQETAN